MTQAELPERLRCACSAPGTAGGLSKALQVHPWCPSGTHPVHRSTLQAGAEPRVPRSPQPQQGAVSVAASCCSGSGNHVTSCSGGPRGWRRLRRGRCGVWRWRPGCVMLARKEGGDTQHPAPRLGLQRRADFTTWARCVPAGTAWSRPSPSHRGDSAVSPAPVPMWGG